LGGLRCSGGHCAGEELFSAKGMLNYNSILITSSEGWYLSLRTLITPSEGSYLSLRTKITPRGMVINIQDTNYYIGGMLINKTLITPAAAEGC